MNDFFFGNFADLELNFNSKHDVLALVKLILYSLNRRNFRGQLYHKYCKEVSSLYILKGVITYLYFRKLFAVFIFFIANTAFMFQFINEYIVSLLVISKNSIMNAVFAVLFN